MLITLAAVVLYVYGMVRYAFMETGRPCQHDGKYKSIDSSSLCHKIFNVKKNVVCAYTQNFSAILFRHKVTIPLYHHRLSRGISFPSIVYDTIYYSIERNVPGPVILMRRYTPDEL